MTNPDETIKFDITETGPDTIEAGGSNGEIISGMTWGEFEENWTCNTLIAIIQTTKNYLMSS
jgi:hypothetical protein